MARFLNRLRYVLSGEAFRDRFGGGLATDKVSDLRPLYDEYHDLEDSGAFAAEKTEQAFERQWRLYPQGRFLLGDPAFEDDVTRILTEEELLVAPAWFKGKRVLDVGCGNGRWSLGFARLGAHVTAIDASPSAVAGTERALAGIGGEKRFIVTPLDDLAHRLGGETFDLVFCWGVLHHCRRFNRAFAQATSLVQEGGLFYAYLYGRETVAMDRDLRLFKERVHFNTLESDGAREAYLLRKTNGDRARLHNAHDLYAPLINRRFQFQDVCDLLAAAGFGDITRTIDHSEIFVRAVKGRPSPSLSGSYLQPKTGPTWFQRTD